MRQNLPGEFMVIGLLFGGVAGAGIFYLSGNLNLKLGVGLIIGFSIFLSATGWLTGKLIIEKREARNDPDSGLPPYKNYVTWDYSPCETDIVIQESQSIYKPNNFGNITIIILSLILAAGSGYMVQFGGVFYLVPVVILVFYAIYNYTSFNRYRGVQYQLTSTGIIIISEKEHTLLEWENIEKIWVKNTKSKDIFQFFYIHHIRILTKTGKTLQLDRNIKNFSRMEYDIQTAVTATLLPVASQKLNNGEQLRFGEYRISYQGISYRGKSLSWNDVNGISAGSEEIQVHKTGKNWTSWSITKSWDIPNYRLFVTLLSRYSTVTFHASIFEKPNTRST